MEPNIFYEEFSNSEKVLANDEINIECAWNSGRKFNFPCDVNAPIAVSVAIGGGGLALLFVVYLMNSVSFLFSMPQSNCFPSNRRYLDAVVSAEST